MTETTEKIKALPYLPPTPEELAKRQRAAARIHQLREKMGQIAGSVDELIQQDRNSH